jgi:hypothetical protein
MAAGSLQVELAARAFAQVPDGDLVGPFSGHAYLLEPHYRGFELANHPCDDFVLNRCKFRERTFATRSLEVVAAAGVAAAGMRRPSSHSARRPAASVLFETPSVSISAETCFLTVPIPSASPLSPFARAAANFDRVSVFVQRRIGVSSPVFGSCRPKVQMSGFLQSRNVRFLL